MRRVLAATLALALFCALTPSLPLPVIGSSKNARSFERAMGGGALAWTHGGGGGGGGGSIPTIVAGSAQPGNTTAATGNVFSTWLTPPTLPGQQGTSGQPGFNDNAIGVWRKPMPMQVVSGTIPLCVIGYSESETSPASPLAKVDFFLDGSTTPVTVSSPNFTETWTAGTSYEYCVQVSDSALADGPHEARAILYPVNGYPRLLSSVRSAATTATGFNSQAHGRISLKVVSIVSAPGGETRFTPGSTWCVFGDNMTPGSFQMSAFTPPYPMNQNLDIPNCGTSAASPVAASEAITYADTNAGMQESLPKFDGSLFFYTNHNGALLPINHDLYVSQPSGGSPTNNCTAAATPCDTISHALKKVDQTVYSCSFAGGGSVNFTGCGSWPVNQAVVMSGTSPGNFQAARPYWVVSSSSGTVQVALEPGGAAQAVSGGGGSVSIVADYSHWNLNLMCPGPCSSPSSYKGPDTTQIAGSVFGVIHNIFGWLNVIPYQTTHDKTVISAWDSNGPYMSALANRVHYQVDVKGAETHAHCDFCTAVAGTQDTWFDGMDIGIVPGSSYVQTGPGQNTRMPSNGWFILTNITTSGQMAGFTGNAIAQIAVGNQINQPFTAGIGWVQSLRLGNVEDSVGAQTTYFMKLNAVPAVGALTLNFDPAWPMPPGLDSDSVQFGPYNGWAVGSFIDGNAVNNPVSGCMGAYNSSTGVGANAFSYLTNITGSQVTQAGSSSVVIGTCTTSDLVALGWGSHEHWQLFNLTEWGGLQGNYIQQFSNMVEAYDTVTNQTGPGLLPEDQTPSANVGAYDLAFIGINYSGFPNSMPCTPSNNSHCIWSPQIGDHGIQWKSNLTGGIFDSDTWTHGGSLITSPPGQTFTDVRVQNNTCNDSIMSGAASGSPPTGGLANTPGWTVVTSPTC